MVSEVPPERNAGRNIANETSWRAAQDAEAPPAGVRECPTLSAILKSLVWATPVAQGDAIVESQVFAERLRILATQSRGIMLPGAITAVLLGSIHWPVVDHLRIVAWILILLAADLLNFLCCDYWLRNLPGSDRSWVALRAIMSTLAITGLAWGCAPMMLDSARHVQQELFSNLFLCAVTMATVGCFYSFWMVIVTRAAALWVPAIIYTLSAGDRTHLLLALSDLLFAVATVQFGRRLSREHVDGLYHLFENRQLSERLGESQQRLARSNDDLQYKNSELQSALMRIEELAIRDELTGLYNRRFVTRQLDAHAEAARERNRPLSVALIDVDHFKQINDKHGHNIGDEVLRFLARAGSCGLRAEDVFARYGGEEFIRILPDTDADSATALAEHFRGRVSAESRSDGPHGIAVTISVGIAEYQPGESLRDWLHRADEALYRAKHDGRNRVVTAVA